MISLRDVYAFYRFPFSKKKQYVLNGVDLDIGRNEIVGIMGPSGSGKSSLARVVLKLLPIERGSYNFSGQNITQTKVKHIPDFRAKVQYLPQSPGSYFDPSYTLKISIKEALANFGKRPDPSKLSEYLEFLQLSPSLLERYPHQVSGGEVQRLALLRILLLEPELIILDEATSMLDISVQAHILTLLKELRTKSEISYLIISHNKLLIEHMCDRMYRLEEGKLIAATISV